MKPGDFFIGAMDFFAILLPGSVLDRFYDEGYAKPRRGRNDALLLAMTRTIVDKHFAGRTVLDLAAQRIYKYFVLLQQAQLSTQPVRAERGN